MTDRCVGMTLTANLTAFEPGRALSHTAQLQQEMEYRLRDLQARLYDALKMERYWRERCLVAEMRWARRGGRPLRTPVPLFSPHPPRPPASRLRGKGSSRSQVAEHSAHVSDAFHLTPGSSLTQEVAL